MFVHEKKQFPYEEVSPPSFLKAHGKQDVGCPLGNT